MKVIKYLLAALLVITITKKAHPNESLVPQTAGHLDTFHDEDEQSIQQDFTPDITQQTPSLHDSISQIPKTTLQSTLPNYKGSYPPTIINMKPLEEKLSDDNPGPLFASETSPIDQEEQENLQPIPTKDKDLITKGMPVSQIVATTLDHIIPDHQTLSDHVIHHIDNALHQESMNEPEESIMPEEPEPIINDLTDQPEEDNFKQEEKPISTEMAHENLMPSMPLRQVIATKVNSILSEATEESVSNILHPTLVDQALTHAIHNPEQENDLQPTDDETYEEKTDQMPSMPVRHIIANKVNSILSEATEESVSNILHPDLVEHALNNPDLKDQSTANEEVSTENLMSSMPLRQVIATKVNAILSEATEESVSNILHPTLVDQALTHAIHNPEQENDLQPTDDETYEEKTDQMPSMPLRQVIATKVNSILSEATEESVSNILHPTLVDQALTHAIHNPEQENDLQPTDDETYEEKTDQMPGMPVRHIIANKVNSILSEATEESVSNILHPDLVEHALNNPGLKDQSTANEEVSTENLMSSMPLRQVIATKVNAILSEATEESVSNILHPDLVEHALNNLDSKNQEPEETIEPASQKNYAAYTTPEDMANIPSQYDLINNQPQNIVSHYIPHPIDPDYSKVMKLGTMGDSDTSAIHENQPEPTTLQTQEEDAPIFVDLASLKLKQGPQPSKNLEYYDPVSKMAQIKNGPLFVGIIEHNKITETPPGSEIRSLKKIPATIPTPDYDQLQHGFYGGISPRTALYGLCVERCNPYSSTVELSYPIKSIQNSNKTIGHYWPDSKIVQYKTGETFVEVVLQKRYHYRTIEKPTLSQIKTWFDQKKLLKQYGISSHDDHFDDLINPDGIGTVEIEKRHKQTLYGVQLINPYRPESKTSSELLQHKKSMTRIVHDTLTPGLDEARAKTKLRIEHALNTLSLKNQS